VSLTYVTGTLVKLGEGAVDALLGRRTPWKSHALMWVALAFGGVLGALAYRQFSAAATACPAAAAAILAWTQTGAARRAQPPPSRPGSGA
jgi:uncharacterized membrane protein YoaK (UPF0700 family)